MLKFVYNIRNNYPSPVVNNTLSTGSAGLTQSTLMIENKKYTDITSVIMAITTAGSYTIKFKNCLFVNCFKIFDNNDLNFGSLTFENCTFVNCSYIVETNETTGNAILLKNCIIFESLYCYTKCALTMENCLYTQFFGYSTISKTNCVEELPFFSDNINYYLSSRNRGNIIESPALKEKRTAEGWTVDAGCWDETRGGYTSDSNEFTISNVPDSYYKQLVLTNYKKATNDNGDIIQFWTYNKEKKVLNFSFSTNYLSRDELICYIDMVKCKNHTVRFFPNNLDNTKYVEGILIKEENTKIASVENRYFETNPDWFENVGFNQINITIQVTNEVGEWLL